MNKRKISYYNYFLFLSLVLIAGYTLTALFFLYRTNSSGQQAKNFGNTVDKTNQIIQQSYAMESAALSFLLTGSEDSYSDFSEKKQGLITSFELLKDHCVKNAIGRDGSPELRNLISRRIINLENLVEKDSLHKLDNTVRIGMIQKGRELSDSIVSSLKEIRGQSEKKQTENRQYAEVATQNAVFMLSIFGAVMLVIVFISFTKMKKEIRGNERKSSEINQINIELKSMNENLENFAYVASHDLNEPLRKIRTFGDLVKGELNNEKPDKEIISSHLSRMQNATARMQQLIHDLLSYSRITRQHELAKEIDLNEVIQTVVSDMEVLIQELDAHIETGKLPQSLVADPVQLRQLFQNLLSNALKFHKPGVPPEIFIDSEIVPASELPFQELRENNVGNYHKISVRDNGIGFDEQFKEKIFAIFQRLHGRSKYQGTGIGLSICKKICENHKGTIAVQSTEGIGSTFFVFLPVNTTL
ncbi:MAG: ATP-binding protein [Brumimicrobium sp.]|nr:ATP-binding protein [Brumimicrobium sp.]